MVGKKREGTAVEKTNSGCKNPLESFKNVGFRKYQEGPDGSGFRIS